MDTSDMNGFFSLSHELGVSLEQADHRD
jgi:hypothetical protein